MAAIKIIALIGLCYVAAAQRVIDTIHDADQTTRHVIILNGNEHVSEEKLIFNRQKQQNENALSPPALQTQLISIHMMDDPFVDYSLISLHLAGSEVLLAIGITPARRYFISLPMVMANGKVRHKIIIERYAPILDVVGIMLNKGNNKATGQDYCALRFFWLEKQGAIVLYDAVYLMYRNERENKIINIQKYDTLPADVRDARMLLHDKSHQIFIALNSVNKTVLYKLPNLTLPRLQASAVIATGDCTFSSPLHFFNERSIIVLLACHRTARWQQDYMIVDLSNGDTSTSQAASMQNRRLPVAVPFNDYRHFRQHYTALTRGMANHYNRTLDGLFSAFYVDMYTSAFLYNDGGLCLIRSPLLSRRPPPLPSIDAITPPALWIECESRRPPNFYAITPPALSLDNVTMTAFSLYPRKVLFVGHTAYRLLASHASQYDSTMPSALAQETIMRPAKEEKIPLNGSAITIHCVSITNEKNSPDPALSGREDDTIWLPILLGVMTVLIFVIIIILLFVIRKAIQLKNSQ